MNFRTYTTKRALTTLGACFGLLFVAGPANARPDSTDAFTRALANHQAYNASHTGIPDSVTAAIAASSAAASDVVIPYLSHGQGVSVDEAGFPQSEPAVVIPYLSHGEGVLVGEDGLPQAQPTVIPYLSHGFGVEASSTPSLRERPDGFQPQLHTVGSTTVADDGFNWETTGVLSGALLAAIALGLMTMIALKDRGGLKSA